MTSYSFDEEGVAFYFFIMTLVGMYVIPATFTLLFRRQKSDYEQEPKCSAPESKAKFENMRKSAIAQSSTKLSKIVLLAVLWAVLAWASFMAWNVKVNFKTYDPFEILGVSHSASDEEVKNAFKKLSRMHHPDKAKAENREKAEAKFVEVSKAYKALTDEKIRKNWEEHGNPDGIRTFSLGVALPAWLVKSNNRIILLLAYILAFGVGLPLLVKTWWGKSKVFSKNGVRHATMAYFFRELKENSSRKKILELLSNATEFVEDVPYRSTDGPAIDRLNAAIEAFCDRNKIDFEISKKITSKGGIKAATLLFCHFHRIEVENAGLRKDQSFIVTKCPILLQGIIQISIARQWLHPSLFAVDIAQCLVQGMWEDQHPLLQLPYVSSEVIKQCHSGKKPVKSIDDFLDLPESDRRKLVSSLSDKEYKEMILIAESFPRIKIDNISFKMLGQSVITPMGLVTCQVKLSLEYPAASEKVANATSEGGNAGKAVDGEEEVETFEFDEDGNLIDDPTKKSNTDLSLIKPVYCPRFEATKRPFWWIGLANRNNTNIVAAPVKVTDLVETKTVTLQFPAPPRPMPVTLLLFIKSDATVGVDIMQEVKFTVHAPKEPHQNEDWDISGEEENMASPFNDDE